MPSTVEIIKLSNIVSAIMLILVGVSQIISLTVIFSAFSFSFFMSIFLPFFLVGFGLLLLASSQKMEFIANNFKFLTSLTGRGLFNIYLASLSVYQLSSTTTQIIGFVIGMLLFATGILYIIVDKCSSQEDMSAYKEQLQ